MSDNKINLEDFYKPKIDIQDFYNEKPVDRISSQLGLDLDSRLSDVPRDRQEDFSRLYDVFQDNPEIVEDYKIKLRSNKDSPPAIDGYFLQSIYGENWYKDKTLRNDLKRFRTLTRASSRGSAKVIGSWPPKDLDKKIFAEDLYDVKERSKPLSETENIPFFVEKPMALVAGLEKGVKGAGLTITELADVVAGTEFTDWLDNNWETIDTGGGFNKVLDVLGQFGLGYGASLKVLNGVRKFKRIRNATTSLKKGTPFKSLGMSERSSKIAGRMGYYSLPALIGDAAVMNLEDKQFGEVFDVYSIGDPDAENLTNREKAFERLKRKAVFGMEGFALGAAISGFAKPAVKIGGKLLTTQVKDIPFVGEFAKRVARAPAFDTFAGKVDRAVLDSSLINVPLRTLGGTFQFFSYPVAGILGPVASGLRKAINKSGLPPFEQWKFFSTHGDGFLKGFAKVVSNTSEKLSTAGALFRDTFDLKQLTEGEIRAITRNVERKMRDLDTVIRKGLEDSMEIGSTGSIVRYEHIIEDLVEYWKGAIGGKGAPGKFLNELPKEMRGSASEIYKALKTLMKETKKISSKDDYDLLLNQIKKHFNEGYRAFRNPKYKPPEEIKQKAIEEAVRVITQQTKPKFGIGTFGEKILLKGEDLSPEQILSRAKGAINEILKETGTKATSLELVETLAKNLGVLKPGEFLPDVMKQLLGKKNARTMLMEVIGGLSQSVWRSHLYRKLHSSGLNRWIFTTRTALQDKGISNRNLVAITEKDFEGKKTMFKMGENPLISKLDANGNPIDGKSFFMTPEMKKALLDDSLLTDQLLKVPVYRQLLQLKASSQYSKTVLSFMTQVRNVTSAFMFPLANGHVGGGASYIDAYRQIVRDLFGRSGKIDSRILDNYGAELERQNILNSSIIIREMKDMFTAIAATDAYKGYRLIDDDMFMKYLTESPIMKKLTDIYQAGDIIHKIYGYEFSKSQYKAAFNDLDDVAKFFKEVIGQPFDRKNLNGTFKTLDEAIQEAAGKTLNNTYPNYNYIPSLVKELRRMPFGNFISFGSEMFRTTGNILGYSLKELSSTNPYIRQMGAKRLMGLSSVFAIAPVSTAVALKSLGMTEEQLDAIKRSLAAPWNKFSNLIPYSFSNDPVKGPVVKYVNVSYSNPYEIIQQPFLTLFGKNTQSKLEAKNTERAATEQFFAALDKLLDPFISESIIYQALMEAKNGKTRRDRTIWSETRDEPHEIFFKSFMHIIKALIPTTFVNLRKIEQGAIRQDDATNHRGYDKYNKPVDLKEELLALFAGIRLSEVNVYDSIDFALNDFNQKVDDLEGLTRAPLYQNSGYDGKQKEFIKGQKAKYLAYNEIRVFLNDAILLGTSGSTEEEKEKSKKLTTFKVNKILEERVTPTELRALKRFRFVPISPVDARGKAMKDSIKEVDEATLDGFYPAMELKRIERALKNIPLLLSPEEFDNYIRRALGLPIEKIEKEKINLEDFYSQTAPKTVPEIPIVQPVTQMAANQTAVPPVAAQTTDPATTRQRIIQNDEFLKDLA